MDRFFEPLEKLSPIIHPRQTGGNNAFYNVPNDFMHVEDPNLRRRLALREIDQVPFGFHHVRAVLVAGIGFFLDSYDIFAINLITIFLGVVFWQGSPEDASNGFGGNYGRLPTPVSQALKGSTSAGIVIGQVLFGWLADVFGRRKMYGVELAIILLSTMSCALASPSPSMTSTGLFTFWRVMMGVGIGGDYPLSSVITSEFAPTRWRGAMMAAVFSMQGIGQLSAAIVALIVTVAFKESFINIAGPSSCDYACQVAADRSWRIIVAAGGVPACIALYYRATIPETPRYTFDVALDVEKADADIKAYMASQAEGVVDPIHHARTMKDAGPSLAVASWADAFSYFGQWKNFKVLLGTTFSWFFLDLAFYGLGLNNSIVLHAIGYSTGETLYHTLYNNCVGMIILACAGSLPGYWTAILTIDNLGRKPMQVFGFLILTVIFCILGFAYKSFSEAPMMALYVVAQFFFNFGPNTTTFIVPGECFPTRYRSTGHGISAAMGKVGAIIAQVISIPLLTKDSDPNCTAGGSDCSPWLDRLMQIFALFMLCGTFVSLLIPETKGITLEELAGEPPATSGGRNGSVRSTKPPKRGWLHDLNPFAGGQPAGFMSPRAMKRRSPRVSIMTSPELAARDAAARERALRGGGSSWLGRKKERATSAESAEYAVSTISGSDDMPMMPASLLPIWSGEWGERADHRVQRVPMQNLPLNDVGSLLSDR